MSCGHHGHVHPVVWVRQIDYRDYKNKSLKLEHHNHPPVNLAGTIIQNKELKLHDTRSYCALNLWCMFY